MGPLFLAILLAASFFLPGVLAGVLPGAVPRSLSVLAMAVDGRREGGLDVTLRLLRSRSYVPVKVAFVCLVVGKIGYLEKNIIC